MSDSWVIVTDVSATSETAELPVSTASADAAERHLALCQQLLAREQAAPLFGQQLGPAARQTAS